MRDLPTARYGLAAATLNGRVYAVGGFNSSGFLATVEEYTPPDSGVWVTRAAVPAPRGGPGVATALNGKLYVIGGNNGSSFNWAAGEY